MAPTACARSSKLQARRSTEAEPDRADPITINQRLRDQSIERGGRDGTPFGAIRVQALE